MAHQNPHTQPFALLGKMKQSTNSKDIKERQQKIYIFLNEHQGMKGMDNIYHEEIQRVKTFMRIIQATQSWQNS